MGVISTPSRLAWRLFVLAVFVVATVGALAALAGCGNPQDRGTAKSPIVVTVSSAASATHTEAPEESVTFRVESVGRPVMISFGLDEAINTVPADQLVDGKWEITIPKPGLFKAATLSAMASGEQGAKITCTTLRGSRVIKTSPATGPYSLCTGSYYG
jgi:hypothetical protein